MYYQYAGMAEEGREDTVSRTGSECRPTSPISMYIVCTVMQFIGSACILY